MPKFAIAKALKGIEDIQEGAHLSAISVRFRRYGVQYRTMLSGRGWRVFELGCRVWLKENLSSLYAFGSAAPNAEPRKYFHAVIFSAETAHQKGAY
jgi:hypothetical protein